MSEDLYSRGFKGTLYNYLGRFGTQALSFLISIYVIRQLNVSAYGIYKTLIFTGQFYRYIIFFWFTLNNPTLLA